MSKKKKSAPNKAQGQKKQTAKKAGAGESKKFKLIVAAAVALVLVAGGFLVWALVGGNADEEGESGLWANLDGAPAADENGDAVNGEDAATPGEAVPSQGENPIVTIEMEDGGIIRAELFPDIAPNTVNNFIYLVNQGFYDGLIFHRVIPGFMIQGGCPEGSGFGNPGYFIAGEFDSAGFPNPLSHEPGVLSMARSMDPDSAGSQFFIVQGEARFLDGDYASFGIVIEGMDVVERIVMTPRNANDFPDTPQIMQRVTVETFGSVFPPPTVTAH